MKQNYVLQLKADMEFMDFFMVKTIAIRVGSNRKKYLDMTLADCTGEISAKKWDISDEELDGINRIQVGDIIKVKAGVTEWKGTKQLRVTRIRHANRDDGLVPADFYKSAPEDSESMLHCSLTNWDTRLWRWIPMKNELTACCRL